MKPKPLTDKIPVLNLPILLQFDDPINMHFLHDFLCQIIPGVKIREVGFYHGDAQNPYVGLVYLGSLKHPEAKRLIALAERNTKEEEENSS